jgi:very-short-patch-repair endonuclease
MSGRAKALRAMSTAPERRMWRLLYPFRTGGYHFRKQVPIGPYVVDFGCHHASLVIEVDGDTHYTDTARRRDLRRDAFLRAQGYTVLRFTNDYVMHHSDGVFDVVSRTLDGRSKQPRAENPLPNPPHKGEGADPVALAQSEPTTLNGTSPLVGEAGRGEFTSAHEGPHV